MNENRPSQMVEAEQTIRVLSAELLRHKEDSAKWKINVEVHLDNQDGNWTITVSSRSGDRGVRKTLTAVDVAYFGEDAESYANRLAMEMLGEVLGPAIQAELTPKLVKAMQNLNQITAKAGFAK